MLTLTFAHGEAPAPEPGRKVNEWWDDRGNVIASAYSSKDQRWISWPGQGLFAFSIGGFEVRVWPEPATPCSTIVDTFERVLRPLVLQALGWQALHAGAALGPTGAVVFCGRKLSGKSTLAFAMHQAGWPQIADDALVLRFERNGVTACPLSFKPRLRPASLAYFDSEKRDLPGSPSSSNVPIAAIFLLQQNSNQISARVSLMPKTRAFSQLLGYAHYFDAEDPAHTRRLAKDYLELVERTPVFSLEYQPDFKNLYQLTRVIAKTVGDTEVVSISSRSAVPSL